jgi:hypothetical protein
LRKYQDCFSKLRFHVSFVFHGRLQLVLLAWSGQESVEHGPQNVEKKWKMPHPRGEPEDEDEPTDDDDDDDDDDGDGGGGDDDDDVDDDYRDDDYRDDEDVNFVSTR